MNDGYPSNPQLSAGQILARLTAAATLAAGAMLYGAGSATLSTLALGTAGRVLVAGASAPAWSDSGLSYASGVLAISGSAPGTPSAGQVLIGGGAIKAGGAISCTMLTASGDILAGQTAGNIYCGQAADTTYGATACVWGRFVSNGTQFNVASSVAHQYEFVHRAAYGYDFYTNSGSVLAFSLAASGAATFSSTIACTNVLGTGYATATSQNLSGTNSDSVEAGPYVRFGNSGNICTLQGSASGGFDFWNYSGGWARIVRVSATGGIEGPKVKLTPEGGIATLVIADEAISVGHVCAIIQGGTANRVKRCPTSGNENDMPVGVAYSAAGAAGDPFWMVVSGRVGVLPDTGVTAAQGYILTTSATTAGLIAQAATAPAAATHFKEIGHFINTGSGAGVITDAIVHFN